VALAEPTTERIEAAILALLAERAPGRTICPSEAARVLAGDDDFRPLMDAVRAQAWAMAARGELEITQRGLPVQPDRAARADPPAQADRARSRPSVASGPWVLIRDARSHLARQS